MNEETGEYIAVKEVRLFGTPVQVEQRVKALEREISIMGRLVHPNVVKYMGTARETERLFIFMEMAPSGSIASKISQYGPIPEDAARKYTQNMLSGLNYLHSQRQPVIHRDIKGANVLLYPNAIAKLGDFGASKQLGTISNENKSLIGTPYWMAPEVIRESGHGRKADIWSVGCTVIEMVKGCLLNFDLSIPKPQTPNLQTPKPHTPNPCTWARAGVSWKVCIVVRSDLRVL